MASNVRNVQYPTTQIRSGEEAKSSCCGCLDDLKKFLKNKFFPKKVSRPNLVAHRNTLQNHHNPRNDSAELLESACGSLSVNTSPSRPLSLTSPPLSSVLLIPSPKRSQSPSCSIMNLEPVMNAKFSENTGAHNALPIWVSVTKQGLRSPSLPGNIDIIRHINDSNIKNVIFILSPVKHGVLSIMHFKNIFLECSLTSVKFASEENQRIIFGAIFAEIQITSLLFLALQGKLVNYANLQIFLNTSPNLQRITLEDAQAPDLSGINRRQIPSANLKKVVEINLTRINEITPEFIKQLIDIFPGIKVMNLQSCWSKNPNKEIKTMQDFVSSLGKNHNLSPEQLALFKIV